MSLRTRTRQRQPPPEDANMALWDFNIQVKQRMAELGTDVAYNADQTPVFFEYMPKSTITTNGARTVWVRSSGKDKERLTCMLLGDSLGRKYVPYLVIKTKPSTVPSTRADNDKKRHGFGLQLWRKMKPLQARHDVVIFGNDSSTRTIAYLERQMEKHDAAIAAAEPFKMNMPAREDVVEWVAQVWDELAQLAQTQLQMASKLFCRRALKLRLPGTRSTRS
ncbi:unnamed protein product [Phytophthora fragariaefolia]|uniref:Unnamed protein product n=1 Tax=Phytophthora fragariaefolia TaxID=1490495 RepID=A0A9W6Y834_9STRA|nr:unnamed protein product [Phytophthora fragariaefolia]